MSARPLVSAVLCTYNRARQLDAAIRSCVEQSAGAPDYELIVVDNNSGDETHEVVKRWESRCPRVHYVFERKQGLSHARNTGLEHARADIVAMFDDDERVAPDWVRSLAEELARHPEVAYVGGKILPRWMKSPPEWLLDGKSWAPLALQDHGDVRREVGADWPVCLIGGNLSVRTRLLREMNGFATELQRAGQNIGSAEDHEFQLRLWRRGFRGLYAPSVIVYADVPAERMEKEYHRRWYVGAGASHASLEWKQSIGITGKLLEQPLPGRKRIFGVPGYIYRELAVDIRQWLKAQFGGSEAEQFARENHIRQTMMYIKTTAKMQRAAGVSK